MQAQHVSYSVMWLQLPMSGAFAHVAQTGCGTPSCVCSAAHVSFTQEACMALPGESNIGTADALQVGGSNFGPYALTNGAFSGPITAPTVPSTVTGAPYPITITYLPDTTAYSNPSPPYTTPLNVSPATTTITEAVNPASTGAGSPVVVSGSVAGSNGATPVGNVNIAVSAALVLHILASHCYASAHEPA